MSRGGIVAKPAMRLIDVREISDSGDTSSRVGASRMRSSKSVCSSASISGRARERNAAALTSATSGYPNATMRSNWRCASTDAFDMTPSVEHRGRAAP